MSDFVLPRARQPARVLLTEGVSQPGTVFLLERASNHDGQESPLEMLNRGENFFAFEPDGAESGVLLISKTHTVTLSVDSQAPIHDPARLEAARMVGVELVLEGGSTLGGWSSYELPEGHRRLIDYLNDGTQPFFAIWTHASTHFVNRHHVLYARPLE